MFKIVDNVDKVTFVEDEEDDDVTSISIPTTK